MPFKHTREVRVRAGRDESPIIVRAELTDQALESLKWNENHVFEGNQLFLICRPEDMYGTPHYQGKPAARVRSCDLRRAMMQDELDAIDAEREATVEQRARWSI